MKPQIYVIMLEELLVFAEKLLAGQKSGKKGKDFRFGLIFMVR